MTAPRLAFVTGAASGLGLAMARHLAAEGCHLFLTDIDPDRLAAEAAGIQRDDATTVRFKAFDVASRPGWREAAETCLRDCGVPDLLILNAGVTTAGVPVDRIDPDAWDRLFSINLNGVFNGIQAVLPHMRAAGGTARIVTVASVLAHFGLAGAADYVASKHAVLGLSEALRLELEGSGITVTVACPGLVQTRLAAARADGRPAGDSGRGMIDRTARPAGIAPELAARIILAAARRGDYLAFTHPEYRDAVASRSESVQRMAELAATGEDAGFLASGVLRLHAHQNRERG